MACACAGGTCSDGQTRHWVGSCSPPDIIVGGRQKYVVADKTPLPETEPVPHNYSLSDAVRFIRQVQCFVSRRLQKPVVK
jgi:hypothetical protein